MARTRDMPPTREGQSEIPAKASDPRLPPQADIYGPQLTRMEEAVDRILCALAPLGAR